MKEIVLEGACLYIRQVGNGWIVLQQSEYADDNLYEEIAVSPKALSEFVEEWAIRSEVQKADADPPTIHLGPQEIPEREPTPSPKDHNIPQRRTPVPRPRRRIERD